MAAPAAETPAEDPIRAETMAGRPTSARAIRLWAARPSPMCRRTPGIRKRWTTSTPTATQLSRAMMVQILYNLEDRPAAAESAAFTDVAADAWYADAVNWAAGEGIVSGYGNGRFGPDDLITREQMANMLYYYAQYKGYDVSAGGELSSFTDGASTSGWAAEAVQWAVGSGLLSGKGGGVLDPQGTATRAEAASIFMRFAWTVME